MRENMRSKIKQSLSDLVASKPFESITVSMLCKNAGITRASFYKYYRNTVEVLNDLKYSFFEKICYDNSLREVQIDVLDAVKNNLTLVTAFLTSSNPVWTDGIPVDKSIGRFYEAEIRAVSNDEKECSFLIRNFRVGSRAILLEWITNGCVEDVETVADYLISTFIPSR